MPNLDKKFIEGSHTSGTVKEPGLPNIIGEFNNIVGYSVGLTTSGAFYHALSASAILKGGNDVATGNNIAFNASLYNSVYGASSTVQPPSLTMRFYIKY